MKPDPHQSRQIDWTGLCKSLLATLALGLALGAAIASSLSATQGNAVTSLTLAATALLLALVVSFTVVPRLYRRAVRETGRVSLNVTGTGYLYLATLLIVAFAAFNTGNNLIYLIFSAGLSLLLISEIFSIANLSRIHTHISIPEYATAKENLTAQIQVINRKTWFPSFSLSVSGTIRVTIPAKAGNPSTPLQRSLLAYLPLLQGGAATCETVNLCFPRRGLFAIDRLEFGSRFPFGFVRKRRKILGTTHIIVLPETELIPGIFEGHSLLETTLDSLSRGWGSDLHSIRPYVSNDNARFLDWKASAKSGQLLIREFTREEERKACLVFNNGVAGAEEWDDRTFEKAVVLCANIARYLQSTHCEIRLISAEGSTHYGNSPSALVNILKLLALIQPHSSASIDWERVRREHGLKLIFRSRSKNSFPIEVWNGSQPVFEADVLNKQ